MIGVSLVELPSSEAVDGGGRVKLMIEQNVKWHTNCRRGINKQKVERSTVKHKSIPTLMRSGVACRRRVNLLPRSSDLLCLKDKRHHLVIRRTDVYYI